MRKEAEAAGEVIAWLDAASQREDAATAQDRARLHELRVGLAERAQARERRILAATGADVPRDALEAGAGGDDEEGRGWHIPQALPAAAVEGGAVSWTLRGFPFLEGLAPAAVMLRGGAAAWQEIAHVHARIQRGGCAYVPVMTDCCTWRPPTAPGEGGGLAAAGVVEGELVHVSLWAVPFLLPPPAPMVGGLGATRQAGSRPTQAQAGASPGEVGEVGDVGCEGGGGGEQGGELSSGSGTPVDSSCVWQALGGAGFAAHPGLRLYHSLYPPGTAESTWVNAPRGQGGGGRTTLENKVLLFRVPLGPGKADAGLLGELLQQAGEHRARAVIFLGTDDGPIPAHLAAARPASTAGRGSLPAFCLQASQGAMLQDGAWVQAELCSDEAAISAALRALDSPDDEVRGAACAALQGLACTLAPGADDAHVVHGRLTHLPALTRGHTMVVPALAGRARADASPHVRRCAVEAVGAVAAAGDALAMRACSAALKDTHWLVAESAGAALAKLVRKGERAALLAQRRLESSGALAVALQREAELSGALTRLVKENLDVEEARLRSFDLEWLVDAVSGRCSSWPQARFDPIGGASSACVCSGVGVSACVWV